MVVEYQKRLISKSRRECVNRGRKLELEIREDNKIELFWNDLLIPNGTHIMVNIYVHVDIHIYVHIYICSIKIRINT